MDNGRSGEDARARWRRVREVFELVVEVPEGERTARMRELCADDEELESQVRTLLSIRPSDAFLEDVARPIRERVRAGLDEDTDGVAPDELIGRELDGKYRLLRRLGAGGMAVVYEALHLRLDKTVAVKLMHASRLDSPRAIEQFQREIRSAARVRHDSAVAVHDDGVFEGRPWFVMDRIEGADLGRWLASAEVAGLGAGGLRARDVRDQLEVELGRCCPDWPGSYWELVARIAARTARALGEAHRVGVIHRDVTPRNIVLDVHGAPHLADFGLAWARDAERLTQSGELGGGTLPYVAPERLRPHGDEPAPAVDVYGLGATLYHLIALRAPFVGTAEEILSLVRTELPPPLRAMSRDVPGDLEAICFRAMEKRPSDRYPSADALAEDLEAFLDHRPIAARPPGLAGRAIRWCRRRPAAAMTLSALAALVAVVLFAAPLAAAERARRAQDVLHEAAARFPAMGTLTPKPDRPASRGFRDPAHVGATLDVLVAHSDDPLFLWYRANYRSQSGDAAGAQADMNALRDLGFGTPVLETLAAALESGDERHWDLAGLEPEVGSWFDHALRGYAAQRWRAHAAAVDELGLALQIEPNRWTLHDLRSMAALSSGEHALAEDDVRVVERAVGGPTARTLHVRAAVRRYDTDASEAECLDMAGALWKQADALSPDHATVLHNLAEVHLGKGEFERAKEKIARVMELRSDYAEIHYLHTRVLEAEGRFDEVEEYYRHAIELMRAEASEADALFLARQQALFLYPRALSAASEATDDADARLREVHGLFQELREAEGETAYEFARRRYVEFLLGDLSVDEASRAVRIGMSDSPIPADTADLWFHRAELFAAEEPMGHLADRLLEILSWNRDYTDRARRALHGLQQRRLELLFESDGGEGR